MKVLYLLNHAGKAGTERYVETLARQLSADGRVEPYFAYHEGGLLVERMQAMGIPTRQIPLRSRFDLKAAKELAGLCREWGIQLIHCHFLREHYIALLAKRYLPGLHVVYTNHFVMANNRITRLSNRLMDRMQDQMIAVCSVGREQLVENGWSRDRIQVIFNGVDDGALSGSRSQSTLRSELSLPDDRFVMLIASRFAHDKGHAYLMRSLQRLSQLTDRPFTMVLAGDGELLEPTRALADQLGLGPEQVRFVGFREDIRNLFWGADLYINSSQHEALSFLIVEAMAAGLPAIITDMGGNSDIIRSEDDGGLLVPYDEPETMARAMLRFMEEPGLLERCRDNARRSIQTKFHVNTMCDATFAVYQAALR